MAQEYDNYDDNKYSQYPTEENKYECRTGPFEGFFVSSVEFCKHVKFDDKDDRKDNRDNMNRSTRFRKVPKVPKVPKVQWVYQELMEPTVSMEPMELMEQTLTHVLHVF